MINKRLVELETKDDFAELTEILSKVHNAHAVGTIKQAAIDKNGEYSYIDLQQDVAESKTIFQINGDYFYITIQNLRRTDVKKMKTHWNTVLQRGTQQFKKGKENDYIFTIDVIQNELQVGFVYGISAAQPIFVSSDGDTDLVFVFPMENVMCSKSELSMYDIEYEESVREDSQNDVYNFKGEQEEEEKEEEFDETLDEAKEIISNDKYIEL